MRLESKEPASESDFYRALNRRTGYYIYYERVEPANESGFPDIYFTLKDNFSSVVKPNEGTIELKFDRRKTPDLASLLRGNQKSALLDYYKAGGRRRFALLYCQGVVYVWDTSSFYREILGDKDTWIDEFRWGLSDLDLAHRIRDTLWRD